MAYQKNQKQKNQKQPQKFWNSDCGRLTKRMWLPEERSIKPIPDNFTLGTQMFESWFATEKFVPRSGAESTIDVSYKWNPDLRKSEILKKTRIVKIYPKEQCKKMIEAKFSLRQKIFDNVVNYLLGERNSGHKPSQKNVFVTGVKQNTSRADFKIVETAIDNAYDSLVIYSKKQRNFIWKSYKNKTTGKRNYPSIPKTPKMAFTLPKTEVIKLMAMKDSKGNTCKIRTNAVYQTIIQNRVIEVRKKVDHRYYLSGFDKVQAPVLTEDNRRNVVAIDPGVRDFASFYALDVCGSICRDGFSRIFNLSKHLDDLISKTDNERNNGSNRVKGMEYAQQRMRIKIKFLINEIHFKTALFLVKNFKVILLPKLDVGSMVERYNNQGYSRKIGKATVRKMINGAHGRFDQILKQKAKEHRAIVLNIDEAYTSKTHPETGNVDHNLGGAKHIVCNNGCHINRDISAARNILIKHMVENKWEYNVTDLKNGQRFHI